MSEIIFQRISKIRSLKHRFFIQFGILQSKAKQNKAQYSTVQCSTAHPNTQRSTGA